MCGGCTGRFVIGSNNMVNPTGFFNTVVSPNPQRLKRGRNVQLGTDPTQCSVIPMLL